MGGRWVNGAVRLLAALWLGGLLHQLLVVGPSLAGPRSSPPLLEIRIALDGLRTGPLLASLLLLGVVARLVLARARRGIRVALPLLALLLLGVAVSAHQGLRPPLSRLSALGEEHWNPSESLRFLAMARDLSSALWGEAALLLSLLILLSADPPLPRRAPPGDL